MKLVQIQWIESTVRQATLAIPDNFDGADVVNYFDDMGVMDLASHFTETDSSDTFREELGNTPASADYDLCEDLENWEADPEKC